MKRVLQPAGMTAVGCTDPPRCEPANREPEQKDMLMKKIIVLSLGLLMAGGLTARAADAKENWDKNCAKCHAENGNGKTKMGEKLGVRDYTDAQVQADMKDEAMIKAIKEGVKEKDSDKVKMKAFGDALSQDEIKALVAYTRGFKK
jgi:cytochrome c553